MKQHNDNEGMQNLKTIESLEEENLRLRIQLQEYQALKDENLRRRKMSEASTKISEKQTLAKVINNNAKQETTLKGILK